MRVHSRVGNLLDLTVRPVNSRHKCVHWILEGTRLCSLGGAE